MASLLWDQHTCLPLQNDADVHPLTRYQRRGGAFVSVNVGYSPHSFDDTVGLLHELTRNPHLFDNSYTRWGPIQWMPPETFLTLKQHLSERGWSDRDTHAVLGGNFQRVAQHTWGV